MFRVTSSSSSVRDFFVFYSLCERMKDVPTVQRASRTARTRFGGHPVAIVCYGSVYLVYFMINVNVPCDISVFNLNSSVRE